MSVLPAPTAAAPRPAAASAVRRRLPGGGRRRGPVSVAGVRAVARDSGGPGTAARADPSAQTFGRAERARARAALLDQLADAAPEDRPALLAAARARDAAARRGA